MPLATGPAGYPRPVILAMDITPHSSFVSALFVSLEPFAGGLTFVHCPDPPTPTPGVVPVSSGTASGLVGVLAAAWRRVYSIKPKPPPTTATHAPKGSGPIIFPKSGDAITTTYSCGCRRTLPLTEFEPAQSR